MQQPVWRAPDGRLRFRRWSAVVASAAGAALALGACSSGGATSGATSGATQPPAEITMWVRASTQSFSQRLVDAYNASHPTKVKITAIPNDNYLQKVGAAAGSKSLPDILASDVVYAPNYVKQGLWADITTKVQALPFYSTLVHAHIDAATRGGKVYAVPHAADSSLIVYNKDLFTKAGLDPNKPPANFDEIYQDAKAIRALGGDTYGFYFPGNCAGCIAYTSFPAAAASGHQPFTNDGTKADFDNPGFNGLWALYKKMFDEGIVPNSAKSDSGPTWTTQFEAGKIGILPIGTFEFQNLKQKAKFDWGVAPLTSPDGSSTSTFVGGDVIGVSATSKHQDAAWDFVQWTLGDQAQVQIIAKNGDLPQRTDLADSQYTSADPRVVSAIKWLANGYTPSALPYGQLINDANGPWLEGFRGAIFGNDPAGAATTMQQKIQAALGSQ